jgi:hypothetical protein
MRRSFLENVAAHRGEMVALVCEQQIANAKCGLSDRGGDREMNEVGARLQQLESVLEFSRELTSKVSLEPLLRKIVEAAAELTDAMMRDSAKGT